MLIREGGEGGHMLQGGRQASRTGGKRAGRYEGTQKGREAGGKVDRQDGRQEGVSTSPQPDLEK